MLSGEYIFFVAGLWGRSFGHQLMLSCQRPPGILPAQPAEAQKPIRHFLDRVASDLLSVRGWALWRTII